MPALAAAWPTTSRSSFSSVPFTLILATDESELGLQPPTQGTLAFDAIEDY
jgi:hypothetical protein